MYESFYGLREKPFSLLPDPDYLYLSPKHLRALTLLEYGMMNQAGFSVICGDTGAGKTTLIRRLLAELGDDTTVGLITNTHKSFGELLSWVLMAFGIDGEGRSKAQMHQLLIEFLITQYAQNRRTVLIVDEAQNMTADQLEELRMLSNINADKDQVLQVILAGQPALRETLRKPELMQFAQRIAVDYYLESLNRDETEEYIRHRLEVAGGSPEIFTKAACAAVYRYSGGTPRLINLLCDTALVYGFAEQTRQIEAQLVEDVVREQHRNSIVPTFNKPGSDVPVPPQTTASATPTKAEIPAPAVETIVTPTPEAARPVVNQAEEQRQAASDFQSPPMTARHDSHSATVINPEPFITAAKPQEPAHDSAKSNVTRIKKPAQAKTPATDEAPAAAAHTATDHVKASARAEPPEAEVMEESAAHKAAEHNTYRDLYPIVHIAEEPKHSNVKVLMLGLVGGMMLTSLIAFGAVYMMFNKQTTIPTPPAAPATATPQAPAVDSQALEAERIRLEAMQKERDAALAMQQALQRERDAALTSAKVQEELRAAEKRAAQMVAEQERRTALEMERAHQRILDAEVAAAKARERERLAREQAEQARIEREIAAERATTVAPAAAAQNSALTEPAPVTQPAPKAEPPAPPAAPAGSSSTKPKDDAQFSTNPCNSPSAKFLSTCKK